MIWGTIAGLVAGGIKDSILSFKEYKDKQRDQKHELELEKIRSNNRIKEAHAGIIVAQEQTKREELHLQAEKQRVSGVKAQSEASVLVAEHDAHKSWYENISRATGLFTDTTNEIVNNVINVVIGLTRPMITYMFLVLVWRIYETSITDHTFIVESILEAFGAVVSFWFYDRGIVSTRERIRKQNR